VDPQCAAAVEAAAKLCADLGHAVEEAAPCFSFEEMARDFLLVHGAHWAGMILGLAEGLGRVPDPEEIEGSVLAWARHCARKSATDYAAAIRSIHRIGRQIAAFFDAYDVFLSPTAAQPPLLLGMLDAGEPDLDKYVEAMFGHMAFTMQFNCSGQPAMSVPLHWTKGGLPVGVQFAAPLGEEATLFRLARQLEQARPWQHRRPTIRVD
jgi:amidase